MTLHRFRRAVSLVCTLLLFTLSLGCGKKSDPPEEEAAAPVHVVSAHQEKLDEWTELIGTTQALPGQYARLTANVEGRVQAFEVTEGAHVKAGQTIADLDDSVRSEKQATVRECIQQVKQAELALDKADKDLKRLEALSQERSAGSNQPLVSPVDVDNARIERKSAESRLEQAKAHRDALDAGVAYYTVRSPIAGRLDQFQVTLGQSLAKGALIAEVINLDKIDVVCSVSPHTAEELKVGLKARLAAKHKVDDKVVFLPGEVVFVAPKGHPQTGNFNVKVRFINDKEALPANKVVHIEVQTEPEEQRWVVDDKVLLEDQDPPAVMVVKTEVKKNDKGEEEKILTARKLIVTKVGIRDHQKKLVEIEGLETPPPEDEKEPNKKPEKFEAKDVSFILEPHGLKDGDVLKVEEH